jgi:hypothetical protein
MIERLIPFPRNRGDRRSSSVFSKLRTSSSKYSNRQIVSMISIVESQSIWIACNTSDTLQIWDAQAVRLKHTLSLAWSAEASVGCSMLCVIDELVYAALDNIICLISIPTLEIFGMCEAHATPISSLGAIPDFQGTVWTGAESGEICAWKYDQVCATTTAH